MSDIGIKISKPGVDVTTAAPKDLLLSSKYSMLKYESDNTGSVVINPGDTNKFVDFPHTLGYVPAFIAYSYISGALHFISFPRSSAGSFTDHFYAYADNTKIRCGYYIDSGAYKQYSQRANDLYDDFIPARSYLFAGNKAGTGRNGCMRFGGINIAQGTTIVSATISFGVDSKGPGVGDMLIQTWGIAEDNTADFSSNPMGRTVTSAVTTQNVSLGGVGSSFGINVTSQVQEIINRAGWVTGNNMGFLERNNGSPTDVYAGANFSGGVGITLTITYGTATTLTFRTIIFKDKIA